jgi:hypothetical protein
MSDDLDRFRHELATKVLGWELRAGDGDWWPDQGYVSNDRYMCHHAQWRPDVLWEHAMRLAQCMHSYSVSRTGIEGHYCSVTAGPPYSRNRCAQHAHGPTALVIAVAMIHDIEIPDSLGEPKF